MEKKINDDKENVKYMNRQIDNTMNLLKDKKEEYYSIYTT